MSHRTTRVGRPPTLAEVLDQHGPLSWEKAVAITAGLAGQVARLHVRGRLHRGISPDAIRLEEDGEPLLPPPEASVAVGGPALDWRRPPELQPLPGLAVPGDLPSARAALRKAGVDMDPRRIDVYQLGALLCELLTGQPVAAYVQSPTAKQQVRPPLRDVLDRALGHAPAARLSTADELARALGEITTEGQSPRGLSPPGEKRHEEPVPPGDAAATQSLLSSADGATPAVGARARRELSAPPRQLAHYQILDRIGRGGMGDVYRGFENSLKRTVAIKVLSPRLSRQNEFVRRFRAEAAAAARLTHANIVQVYFIGEDAGRHFFAMQYVDGETLAERLARQGRLSVEEVVDLAQQILEGLAAAHREGLIHRDIKASNVLLDKHTGRALLADFGLVKSVDAPSGATASGIVLGTADYISPEQARGLPAEERSDLYSIGVLLYEMLSGRLPFAGESPTALLFQHACERPPPLAEVSPTTPDWLAAAVDRLLAKSPEERYASAEEVLALIRRHAGGEPPAPASRPVSSARSEATLGETAQSAEGSESVWPMTVPNVGWLERVKDRIAYFLNARSPKLLERWQNTQQQVDAAVVQYGRRVEQLAQLFREAESARDELLRQAEAHRDAASASQDPVVGPSRVEAAGLARTLEQEAKQHEEQVEQLRLRLSAAKATLRKLEHQRHILNARLGIARAGLPGGGEKLRRRKLLWASTALLAIAMAASLPLAMSFRRDTSPASPATAPAPPTPSVRPRRVSGPPPRPASEQFDPHAGWADALAVSPTGTRFAASYRDAALRLWDLDKGTIVRVLRADVANQLAPPHFSHDGQSLLASGRGGRVSCWRLDDQDASLAWSDNLATVRCSVLSRGGRYWLVGFDGGYRLYEAKTGRLLLQTIEGDASTYTASFSEDDSFLLVAGAEKTGVMLDLRQITAHPVPLVIRRLDGHAGPLSASAFSPAADLLLTGASDATVFLWDTVRGEPIDELAGHAAAIRRIQWAMAGHRALTCDEEGLLQIWDMDAKSNLRRLKKATAWAVSPDGKWLAAAVEPQHVIELANLATGRTVERFGGYDGQAGSIVFLPNQVGFLSASSDGVVRLYRVPESSGWSFAAEPPLINADQLLATPPLSGGLGRANGMSAPIEIDTARQALRVGVGQNFRADQDWLLSLEIWIPAIETRRQILFIWGDQRAGQDPVFLKLDNRNITAGVEDCVSGEQKSVRVIADELVVNRWTQIQVKYLAGRRQLLLSVDGRQLGMQPCRLSPRADLPAMPLVVGSSVPAGDRFMGRVRAIWFGNLPVETK